MSIEDFVKTAIKQDNRNVFEKSKAKRFVPIELQELYTKANPIDVEISMNGNTVHFFPLDELEEAQSDYSLGENRFVFGSCNGDPIYVYDGKIYTCCHGTSIVKDELMADNMSLFMDLIDLPMKNLKDSKITNTKKRSSIWDLFR